jgi:hypothetical protein
MCTTDMPWRVEVKEDPGGLLLQEILSTHSTTLLFGQKMCSSFVHTCFWASRIRILLSSCKNIKKNLDSYYFVTFFTFYLSKKM